MFITLLVEFISLYIWFKPRPSILRLLAYTLGANLASHLTIILIAAIYAVVDSQINYLFKS